MTEYNDLPIHEAIQRADKFIQAGAIVFFKFTCIHCGARQASDTPNAYHTGGYTCEECGKLSHPTHLGFALIWCIGSRDSREETP